MAETPPDGYVNELRREIMRSEIQRVRMLAIVLTSLLVVTLIVANFFPEFTRRMFRGGIAGWVPLAGIGPFVLYEWVALFVLRRRAAQDKDFPRIGRFANALIETSLPSVIIVELSHQMDMPTVLGYWPPMLYFVFILLSTLRLDFWLSAWTGAVAAVQLLALAAWLLPIELFSDLPERALTYNISRSIVLLGSGIIAGIVAGSLRRQFEASVAAAAARDRVTNLFGQHVSPAVVDRLLATATDPPSEMRRVCVLFLDIRGFTALFGAPLEDPKAAVHALAAARGMLDAVDAWNKARPDNALRVGIGIHIGDAVTGTVGSPQRKEYTVIGDTVNLAARLEQLTKETGARLLISSSMHEATTGADGATDLGPLAIRGYDQAVRVWRVA